LITWNRYLLNINSTRKIKTNRLSKNQVVTRLTALAIFLTWLIGLIVGVIALGFVVNGDTFNTFLWAAFEMVLLTSLGMLFVTSMVIVHNAKRQRCKGKGDNGYEHLYLIAKHLIAQMIVILVVILLLIVNFLILDS
jgi:uncharacterized membrane protein